MSDKKKKPNYELVPPTPEAVALIMRAVEERKAELMEGLLANLWQAHEAEIELDHEGDDSCSYCDTMRAACAMLKLEHPSMATEANAPRGPVYGGEG